MCVPGTIVGSQMYSATYSSLGMAPEILLYVDQFSDAQCQVCTTCGTANPIIKIPALTASACSFGTSYQVVSFKSTPTTDGVPPLELNYKNTNYYASESDCKESGKAPVIITSKFTGDAVTREAAPFHTQIDTCSIISAPIVSNAPYYGYCTPRTSPSVRTSPTGGT